MKTYSEKVGSKLNDLLEKSYDAEKGYKKAAENVKNVALKSFFKRKAQERYDFGHELKTEIKSFGQQVDKGGSLTGAAHRAWMDIKNILGTDSEETMLEEALKGEEAAVSEYRSVLEETNLPISTKNILEKQQAQIQSDLSTIKRLEDLQ
ncbi:PA2169 family four-helix-bundle protein [Sungkyunkwania multivorans]|uniref:PA2169 family four-helix-bundle protein n=1 Tax=Sungkyunkwania multivorans TaxID=1173618 RepID=A0ABW3CSF7_9FLAO